MGRQQWIIFESVTDRRHRGTEHVVSLIDVIIICARSCKSTSMGVAFNPRYPGLPRDACKRLYARIVLISQHAVLFVVGMKKKRRSRSPASRSNDLRARFQSAVIVWCLYYNGTVRRVNVRISVFNSHQCMNKVTVQTHVVEWCMIKIPKIS